MAPVKAKTEKKRASQKKPTGKPTKATASSKGDTRGSGNAAKMAGYVVFYRNKPLALTLGEALPKNGILVPGDIGTLFTRYNAAQGAITRTVKYTEGSARGIQQDGCRILRLDQPPGVA